MWLLRYCGHFGGLIHELGVYGDHTHLGKRRERVKSETWGRILTLLLKRPSRELRLAHEVATHPRLFWHFLCGRDDKQRTPLACQRHPPHTLLFISRRIGLRPRETEAMNAGTVGVRSTRTNTFLFFSQIGCNLLTASPPPLNWDIPFSDRG